MTRFDCLQVCLHICNIALEYHTENKHAFVGFISSRHRDNYSQKGERINSRHEMSPSSK